MWLTRRALLRWLDTADVVKEMIEGFCLINPRCTFLDGFGEAVRPCANRLQH